MLLLAVIAFIAGAGWLQTQAALPSWELAAWMLSPWVLLIFYRRRGVVVPLVLMLLFCVGVYYAAWRAEARLESHVPPSIEWKDIIIEGVVSEFAESDYRRTKFYFDIDKVIKPSLSLKLRARLSDYHHGKSANADIKIGARLRFTARIRPPRQNFNPGGFDYAGYLFARGVHATGYVRSSIIVLAEGGGWRYSLRQRALAVGEYGAFLAAFIVGDKSGITDEQWLVLRRTGVAHLLSVSGTHITLAAGFAALLCGWLWRRSRRLMRIMPAQKAALLAAVPAALLYAWLAGLGVPVQRSALMFLAAATAILSGGVTGAPQVLAIAAFVVVAFDPWAVMSPGFWLSFMLAGAVVYAAADSRGGWAWRLLKLQCLVSLFAMPLTLWFFNEASLISPLANIIAVPIVGFIVLPTVLLDVILPADILWHLSDVMLALLWEVLSWMSSLPFASWQVAAPWWLFISACLGAMWMLMPRGTPLRYSGIIALLAMLVYRPPLPAAGTFNLTVLDVGQGISVVVQTRHHTLIYDTGPRYAINIVEGFLRRQGIRKINMLMVSHDDADHNGGASLLLKTWQPAIYSTPPTMRPPSLAITDYMPCEAGRQWQWDGVQFMLLHPLFDTQYKNDNETSCVLKITAQNGAALLTGDITQTIEKQLLQYYTDEELKTTLLLIPHHGSRYSSSEEFLDAAQAETVVFSAGANNRFGHPHPQAIKRAADTGAVIYRTDKDGAIIMRGNNIIKWREHNLRYWHHNNISNADNADNNK